MGWTGGRAQGSQGKLTRARDGMVGTAAAFMQSVSNLHRHSINCPLGAPLGGLQCSRAMG